MLRLSQQYWGVGETGMEEKDKGESVRPLFPGVETYGYIPSLLRSEKTSPLIFGRGFALNRAHLR